MTPEQKTLEGSSLVVAMQLHAGTYYVSLHIDGALFDWREFADGTEARRCYADYLGYTGARPKPERELELDRSYIERLTRISTGRRIGQKPSAA